MNFSKNRPHFTTLFFCTIEPMAWSMRGTSAHPRPGPVGFDRGRAEAGDGQADASAIFRSSFHLRTPAASSVGAAMAPSTSEFGSGTAAGSVVS